MTMKRERRERSAWPAVLFVAALFACDSWHGPGGGSDCALDAIGGDDEGVVGEGGTPTPPPSEDPGGGGGGGGDADASVLEDAAITGDAAAQDAGAGATMDTALEGPLDPSGL